MRNEGGRSRGPRERGRDEMLSARWKMNRGTEALTGRVAP